MAAERHSLLPVVGPDGLAMDAPVIAYTEKIIEEEQLQLKRYIKENYSKIRDVEIELENLTLEMKLTAGPKKAALEHLRKKIELSTERMHAAKIKEAQARKEFNRVQLCKSAKEIWDKLAVTYEGTSQVKATKVSLLTHKYELFKMEETETISDMFTRFTSILNELKGLGKEYENGEVVRKILRCLPHSWSPKVTAIEEAKDLSILTMDELMGSLITHEIIRKDGQEEGTKKKDYALIASSSSSEEDEVEGEDKDIALISRQFKKFLTNRGKQGRLRRFFKRPQAKGEQSKKEEVICYECRKPGHYKDHCPEMAKKLKYKEKIAVRNRFKKNKDAMIAAWSDEDSSSTESETEENALMCFMANDSTEGCLGARKKKWFIDSGYSRHMTGDKCQFNTLERKDGGLVTFGDNGKGKVKGIGCIGEPTSTSIDQVLFVEGLKHNLLSVSQLCDSDYKVWEAAAKAVKDEEAVKQKLCDDLNQLVQESAASQFSRLEELKKRLEALNPSRASSEVPEGKSVPCTQSGSVVSNPVINNIAHPTHRTPEEPPNCITASSIAAPKNDSRPSQADIEGKVRKKASNLGRGRGNILVSKGRGSPSSGWTGAGFDVDGGV